LLFIVNPVDPIGKANPPVPAVIERLTSESDLLIILLISPLEDPLARVKLLLIVGVLAKLKI
jgi:hypothetical protein